MEASSIQMPVGSSRKKLLYFGIVVIATIAITTTGLLIYDNIQEQEQDLHTAGQPAHQVQTLTALTSHRINASVTTPTQRTGSTSPSSLSGVTGTSIALEIPTATFVETKATETESVSSHISDLLTSDIAFTTQVQLYDTSVYLETPALTNVEQETTETEVTSSHTSAPLTSDSSFTTPIQTNTTSSTESITTENMSTSKSNISDSNATTGYPTDCSEFNISVGLSVIRIIYPYGSADKTALVNCVSTSDGIWTVIHSRFDGSVDFYRNWTDYKEGFGDAAGEYWLGNDAIYQITSRSSYELKVVLKDWDNATAYQVYDTFRISNESDGYRLTVEGNNDGTAGDSLAQYNGEMFSTLDRDNDGTSALSCAQHMIGAWWYRDCSTSNLNGHYYNNSAAIYNGIRWTSFTLISLKEAKMMIQKTGPT